MKVFEIDSSTSYSESLMNEFIRKSYHNNIINICSQVKILAKIYSYDNKLFIYIINPSTQLFVVFTLYINTIILYMNWIDDKLFIVFYDTDRLHFSIMSVNGNVLHEDKYLEFVNININSFKFNYNTNSIYFLHENFITKIQGKDLDIKKIHYIDPDKTTFVKNALYFQYQTDKNICIVGHLDIKSEIFNTITIINNTGLDFNDIEYTFLDSKIILDIFGNKVYFLKIV